jgi:hypothetical protein
MKPQKSTSMPKPKIQLPTRIKKTNSTAHVTPGVAQADAQSDAGERMSARQKNVTDDRVVTLAKQWAELHANRKTRDKMDDLLDGLSEQMQRKVVLCGQRIASGLPIKIAADTP